MPRIKRWHPISHEFNHDAEVIELRLIFGDWMALVWQECLSIADRNDGEIRGSPEYIARSLTWIWLSNSKRYNTEWRANKIRMALEWMSNKGWINIESASIRIAKYWIYHRHEARKKEITCSLPDLTRPDLTILKTELLRSNSSESHQKTNGSSDWPMEDLWLKQLILEQVWLNGRRSALEDHSWWEAVAKEINGIQPEFIQPEFAKMSAWLKENPARMPTSKGIKRFVRRWLERGRETERRKYGNQRQTH